MLSTRVFTADDLDEIGCSFGGDLPLELATQLVDAVDRGLIADRSDTGYALMLAAEITERDGDLHAAALLVERAVEAHRAHGDQNYGYPQAFHAELLLRLGRSEEAMAELTALRPLMSEDGDAAAYVGEALEGGGRADIAEQWLTEALHTVLRREPQPEPGQSPEELSTAPLFTLVQQRHRLRRDLDLPHDEHDELADRLLDDLRDVLGDDERGCAGRRP